MRRQTHSTCGVGNPQHPGHKMLDFGRVLGGGMDQHGAVLVGNGQRHLAFEVEMLLAADPQRAGQTVRRRSDGRFRLAAPELVRRQHLGLCGKALIDRDDGACRLDLDDPEAGGTAGLIARGGDHGKHHLAMEHDAAVGEDRIVAHGRAAVVDTWNVGHGEDGKNAGRGACLSRSSRVMTPQAVFAQ
jgi:hypothetical protein